MAMAGAMPVMMSTSGLLIFPRNCRAVGRKARRSGAFALGENRVEGQSTCLSRESRHDDEFMRNFDLDVAEVVDPRSFDIYGVFVVLSCYKIFHPLSECFTLAVMYLLVVKAPKPSACRSGGSALGFALSGRSKSGLYGAKTRAV